MKRGITTFVTSLISIPTIIFICSLCAFMSAYITQQKENSFSVTVENLSSYIKSTYSYQIKGITDLVNNAELKAFINNPNDANLRADANAIFLDTFNFNDSILKATLYTPNGTVLLASDQNTQNISPENPYFQNVIQKKRMYSELTLEQNRILLSIVYPVMENGNIIAVYRRLTPLNYLTDYAQTMVENNSDVLIISNNTGVFFDSKSDGSNNTEVFTSVNSSQIPIVTSIEEIYNNTNETNGIINFNYQNTSNIGAYTRIKDLDWFCMVSQSRAEIFYSLNLFQLCTLLVSIVLIAIIFLITRHYILSLLHQLDNVQEAMADFLSGNSEARVDLSDSSLTGTLESTTNQLIDEASKDKTYIREMEYQLNDILSTDPITGLSNNLSLYRFIDENYPKSNNQALIMLDLDGYEEINKTFGNSLANRLLEIVASTIRSLDEEDLFISRLAHDRFCLYLPNYNDVFDVNDIVRQLYHRLKLITQIDDLQVELQPFIGVVYKNKRLLGRSDWLRVATEALERAHEEKKRIIIFDFDRIEDEEYNVVERFDNILNSGSEVHQGFSPSEHSEKTEKPD